MTVAPGISIASVLDGAPEGALRSIIGRSTIDVLSVLNPELLTRENLAVLALQTAEPIAFIRKPDLRDALISLLPIDKARELARKLKIRVPAAKLYTALRRAAELASAEPALMSFFGIIQHERNTADRSPSRKELFPSYPLFGYQYDICIRALNTLDEHPHTAVVHMPTGSGKTRTAMHIVCEMLRRHPDRLVVWLAQNAELLDQASDEFERAWHSLGVLPTTIYRFWGDHAPDLVNARAGFLVAGLGKLHALYKRDPNMILRLGDRTMLTIVDEAHQAIAPSYSKLIRSLKQKRPNNALLGLTATPGRTWADIAEDAALAEFFGSRKISLQIAGYTNPVQYLIVEGFLAKPTFNTLNIEPGFDLSKADLRSLAQDNDVPPAVLERLASDEQRNLRIISTLESLRCRHKRILLFASSVRHAHVISSVLTIRGTRSFVVTALTDDVARDRIITKFRSADDEPIILCNFGVLTTGFDAPKTSAVVIARPTRSLVLYSQMVGRAIRGPRAGGNATADVITVVDPQLPGFGSLTKAFLNWEDVWENG